MLTDGRVREATADDVAVIFEIRVAVRENFATRESLYASGINEESVRVAITTEGRGFVAEDEGQRVGFSIADKSSGSVFALFVRPEYEGRGHGSALLESAVRWLFDQGFETVWLAVGPNTRAHHFYLRHGWVETGAVEPNGDIEMKRTRNAVE